MLAARDQLFHSIGARRIEQPIGYALMVDPGCDQRLLDETGYRVRSV